MIKLYKCEYCDKTFENELDCQKHEKEDHKSTDKYEKVIKETVKQCNSKYNMRKQVYDIFINISAVLEYDNGDRFEEYFITFMLDNDEVKICKDELQICEEIKNQINKIYLKDLNKLEGKLNYKLGGYYVNDIKIKDLLKDKEGKIVKIEIFDTEEIVKPLNKQWISVNLENQGFCPKCNTRVVDGYFKTDKKCPKCGVRLDWK